MEILQKQTRENPQLLQIFTKKKNKNLCDKKSISQEYIENIVLTATKEFLNHTDLNELSIYLADTYSKSIEKDKILESLNKQLQENNKKLANFLCAIGKVFLMTQQTKE